MPFALIVLGIVALVVAVRDTGRDARALLLDEFTGQNNFISWIAGIGAVGAIGYIPSLRAFSRLFLILVFIGIFLAHKGFFDQFRQQVLNRSRRSVAETGPANIDPNNLPPAALNPGGQAPALNSAPATTQQGSFPAGVGSSAPWTAGLPSATGRQAPCPVGAVSQQVPGWNGTAFRCVPT